MTSAERLLDLWDRASSLRPVARGVALLSGVWAEATLEQRWHLPLGERNRRLFRLREVLFGPDLPCVARCPRCEEVLEFTLPVGLLPEPGQQAEEWTSGDLRVRLRLPDSTDLAALSKSADPEATLLERCAVPTAQADLRPHASALLGLLLAADPAADPTVDLSCPACGQGWEERLDPEALLAEEIGREASIVMDEVHLLASTYGWSEEALLAMSPSRRQAYLARVNA